MHTSERLSMGKGTGNRRTLRIVAAVVVGIVAIAVVAMTSRMNDVPANLDLATTRLSAQGLYRATFQSALNPIAINQIHEWTLHVETPQGQPVDNATIQVDGDMPQHGHGMPTQPRVTEALGNGDYRVEGMKFQMTGWWVIDFEISAGGSTDKVSFNLMLR